MWKRYLTRYGPASGGWGPHLFCLGCRVVVDRGGHGRHPKGLSFCMTCEKMPRKLNQSHASFFSKMGPAPRARPARSAATRCAAAGAHRPTSDTRPCLSRPPRPRYSVVVQTVCPSGVPQSPRCVLCVVLDGFVVYFVTGPCYAWC